MDAAAGPSTEKADGPDACSLCAVAHMSDRLATLSVMVNPTWEERDPPVLRAIVEMSDEGAWIIEPDEIAERAGFDEAKVKSAPVRLGC
ncbi:hypothetical protein [Micromonospora musae]|uniref:hypothetical protein n=1 Tax=Micromonospora musae TaxID=1894970 RepID=UPI003406C645